MTLQRSRVYDMVSEITIPRDLRETRKCIDDALRGFLRRSGIVIIYDLPGHSGFECRITVCWNERGWIHIVGVTPRLKDLKGLYIFRERHRDEATEWSERFYSSSLGSDHK